MKDNPLEIAALWMIAFVVVTLLAVMFGVLFYFLWNGLAPTYFYWLPEVYWRIPFWDCVGLFILMPMIKFLIYPGQPLWIRKTKDE